MCYNKVMISDNIIVALITGLLSFAGVVISNYFSNKRNSIESAKRDQQIEDKIQNLTDRVDKHNGMVDKIGNIEKSIVRIETKLEEHKC